MASFASEAASTTGSMESSSCDTKGADDSKMNACQTTLNVINTIIGVGVLSVPFAFSLANYWAVLLLVLGVGIMTFTAYLIGEALKIARCLELDASSPADRDYMYLAELSYGHCGRSVVAVITVTEVWISSVACLVMSGCNIRNVLGVDEKLAVLVSTVVSSIMIFIPLRLYACVSLASMLALLIASSCFVGELFTMDTTDWSLPEMQLGPEFGNLFRAHGLFMFCFAGHPCLPTLHEGMRQPKRWTSCVFWSFSIAMIFYFTMGLVTFLAKGQQVHAILTADTNTPWLQHITVALFAVKIQFTTPLLLRVVVLSLQFWPSCGNVKELLRTSWPLTLAILITAAAACTLAKEEAALASLTGALLMTSTCVIIPIVMYVKLSLQISAWSLQSFKNKAKLLICGILLVLGLVTAVGGTYMAVLDMMT